jgi:hypothetical protein
MSQQFWRIDYCRVSSDDDLEYFSDVMDKLLKGGCCAHQLSGKVCSQTDPLHDNEREIFALVAAEKHTSEFDLRWHFQEECRRFMDDDDYTIECSLWLYKELTPDEYATLLSEH